MRSQIVVIFVLSWLGATFLQGCGGGGHDAKPTPPPTPAGPTPPTPPTPTPTSPTPSPPSPAPTEISFNCESDLKIPGPLLKLSQKGMALDDDTLFGCTQKIPVAWPNSGESIKHIRLFKAYRPGDSEEKLTLMRETLVAHVKANGIKVLVGSRISCSKTDDEEDWNNVKLMMKSLGKEHVLALAVGNELDQFKDHGDVPQSCFDMLWKDGYLLNQTTVRINEARTLLGNPDLPVTSVFTAGIIYYGPDTPKLGVRAYLKAVQALGNFVFTLNYYPIFDPNNVMDPDGIHCEAAIARSRSFNSSSSAMVANLVTTRAYIQQITNRSDDRLWIGEVGWSSPLPDSMNGSNISKCQDFQDKAMQYEVYRNFLQWNLTFPGGVGVDLAFYFTIRDSENFGNKEYFGLIENCNASACKLTKDSIIPSKPSKDTVSNSTPMHTEVWVKAPAGIEVIA